MIHTASLVHDDVVDDCDTRRGDGILESKGYDAPLLAAKHQACSAKDGE